MVGRHVACQRPAAKHVAGRIDGWFVAAPESERAAGAADVARALQARNAAVRSFATVTAALDANNGDVRAVLLGIRAAIPDRAASRPRSSSHDVHSRQ